MAGSRTDVLVALPRPLTSLIGREIELTHLYELLRSEASLVTITGFGGIGKTRLSLQAALELEPIFDAGAIFVSLASVTQASSIPRALALTAGLEDSIETVAEIAEALGPSSRLLVLDNLEQIPDAAGMVMELLQAMPQATILATSRNRLELTGEYVLPLEPLETQSNDPRTLPSVQLFIERGKATAPSLPNDDESVAIIAHICHKLDGIPLAIELAAARLAIFSLTDLRNQLEHILPVLASKRVDMPDRQRTMRNAIAWTYELLEESERRLFTWLSVYEHDFSLESVAHVAHNLELTDDPLDLVQFLVSRSLIRPSRREAETPRYQMLQMLREFGHEHLLVMNEDNLARRSHAMEMVALAERAEPHLITSEATAWKRNLDSDMPNLHLAVSWATANNEYTIAQRIVGAVYRYFESHGYVSRFLSFDLQLRNSATEPLWLVKALIGTGNMLESQNHLERARENFQLATELAAQINEPVLEVNALTGLGTVYYGLSDLPLARHYQELARDLAERIDYTFGLVVSRSALGTIKIQQQELDEAIQELQSLLKLVESQNEYGTAASICNNLSTAFHRTNNLAAGDEYLLRGLEHSKISGNLATTARLYANLMASRLLDEDYDAAQTYAEQGLHFARKSGSRDVEAVLLINLSIVYSNRADFRTSSELLTQASTILEGEDGSRYQVHIGTELVEICKAIGLGNRVIELLSAVVTWRERLQLPLIQIDDESEIELLNDLIANGGEEAVRRADQGSEFDMEMLVREIRAVAQVIANHAGEVTNAPTYAPQIRLTPRETEVLGLLAQGHTNNEIADEMFVSTRTVTTHISKIFTKLDVNNRARAIAVAMQAGLV